MTINPHTRMRDGSLARKLFRLFSRHISGTQLFRENRHVNIHLLVVHNPLVPLNGRLVACSARTRADRQTDRQTDRTTTVTLAAHARRGLTRCVDFFHMSSEWFDPTEPSLTTPPRTRVTKLYTPCYLCNDVVREGSMCLNHPEQVHKHPSHLVSPVTM